MGQLGGGFRCVFACSIGPILSNEPGKYAGPGKYAMVLATFVLSTSVVDISSTGSVDQIYEREYHLSGQMDNACVLLICPGLVITLSLCE